MALTIKQLVDLKDILSTDSISTTRLTVNDNFHKLRRGLVTLIDSLGVDAGPNIVVDTVDATDIVANSFSTPLPRGGPYLFHVNSNGEITAKSLHVTNVVETPRIRLDPDPTTAAFQAGEIRWTGSDFVGWDGTQWISFTAGATGGEANTASNQGAGVGLFKTKLGVDLQFKTLTAGAGISFVPSANEVQIVSSASSGFSGFSGISGQDGTGISGFSGKSGISGQDGISGFSGVSGKGISGFSGLSGGSGISGFSGVATSGFSGKSGISGGQGISGFSGLSGTGGSGYSGYSGQSGNAGPVVLFRAYLSGDQNFTTTGILKVNYDAITTDTTGDYDYVTNYRYTPQTPGNYYVGASVQLTAAATGNEYLAIYLNGSEYSRNGASLDSAQINDVITLNGSTDYIEIFFFSGLPLMLKTFKGGSNFSIFESYLLTAGMTGSSGFSGISGANGVGGAGTPDFLVKWTGTGNTQGDAVAYDDGIDLFALGNIFVRNAIKGGPGSPLLGTGSLSFGDFGSDDVTLSADGTLFLKGWIHLDDSSAQIGFDGNSEIIISATKVESTAPLFSIVGPIKIADGTQGVGKVLTGTDNFGNANWQTPTGGGSGLIGPSPETGSPPGQYTNGLFDDFVSTSTIGLAVDRFNQILLALAPPPAPHLTDWTQTTLSLSVPGKLSFDSLFPIVGYNNADSAVPPVSVDGLFNTSGKRLGVSQKIGGGDLSGVLNDQVVLGPGAPTPAYPPKSFGDADKGFLKMYINGVELVPARITLTSTTSAIDTTSGGTTTGMSVSAQNPAFFPSGTPLIFFQNRTGTWKVKKADLVLGYNKVQIKHEVTVTDIRSVAIYEVVFDGDTTATAYSAESLHTPIMTGSKKLSGIDYHTGGSLAYDITIDNAYRNTYSPSASAISYNGNSNAYGLLLTSVAQALGANGGNEALTVNITSHPATIVSPNRRIINGPLSLSTTVLRTVQGTTTSTGSTMTNFLVDNFAASSTNYIENFDDETYRLNTNSNYNLITDVTAGGNVWDSIQSVKDGSAGHTTGMQTIDGKLVYPGANVSYPSDFRTSNIIHGSPFNNGPTGGTGRDYTGLAGNRTYYRYFLQVSPTTANFVMTINGSGGTFVNLLTGISGNNITVEVKLPTQSGWMDAYDDFITGQFTDGKGARSSAAGAGRAFGVAWGLTVGTLSTANSGGYVLVRITTGPGFTGSFTNINFTFS